VRDTAASPDRARAAVEELVGLGVAAVAGEYHSVAAISAATTAEALGVPFLCSSAVLDGLTEEPADQVARLAPAQSYGWRIYADFLSRAGHRRIAVAAQDSVYWASGTRILRDHLDGRASIVELDADALDPKDLCEEVARSGASVVLILTGYPEPAVSIVRAIRQDARLTDVLIGAPAGQPELAGWSTALGELGAGIPFLSYLPARLKPHGTRVAAALREALGEAPSFVAFEGYETIAVLAQLFKLDAADRSPTREAWPRLSVEGARGTIRFSRVPGISVWQWAWPPVQVVSRDSDHP
jgi:ABC-type branched-subunit amino acid transport system substrate-binding protein